MKKTTLRVLMDIVFNHEEAIGRENLAAKVEENLKATDLRLPSAAIEEFTVETIILDDLSVPQYPASQMQHVANEGCQCPRCGSTEIEGGSIDLADGRATQPQYCLSCDAEWDDVYLFSGYANLK